MERAAVLRVKRKCGGSAPAEALVLACKRLRTEPEAGDVAAGGDGVVEKNLFRLVATVASQDEPVQKYVQEAITKDKAAQSLRPSLGSTQRVMQDLRSSKEARRQESRYRLIASHRPNLTDDSSTLPAESNENKQLASEAKEDPSQKESHGPSGSCGEFQLFDIVQEENVEKDPVMPQKTDEPDVILCNAVEMIRERLTVSDSTNEAECSMKDDDYVYDIYYMETNTPGWIENILSVQPYAQDYELVDEERIPEEVYDDEDDENNENNWRNDYPDEEELFEEDDSDRETSGSSDEGSGHIRRTWEKYQADVLREFDYDGLQELDSE